MIDSTDLTHWADKKDSRDNLPLLIRRLVNETTIEISFESFASGESTQYSGWDGILVSKEETDKISKGTSVWEFGTSKDYKKKASEDYEKRTKDPLGYNIKESTFIFVTPRVWEQNKGKNTKVNWIKERKKDGWKDIRIYDALDLENWLSKTPVTSFWLSQLIGKYPTSGLQPAEDFWKSWRNVPEKEFTSALVLAGRKVQLEQIIKWLQGPPSAFALRALTREEALAFLCAVIESMDNAQKESYYNKCLIVKNIEAFKSISDVHSGHILINYFDETNEVYSSVAKGNHVFIPLGPDNTNSEVNAGLQVLGFDELIKALKEIGFTDSDASHYSKESGRSLSVLRRMLLNIKNQPIWARKDNAIDLIPLLLAGRWDESKKWDESRKERIHAEDEEIISFLAGISYNEYIKKLTIYNNIEDPPVYQLGDKWRLVSPIDAWFALAPYLTKIDLDKFADVFLKVIGELDPEIELKEDERYMASLKGKVRKYSDWLIEGLLQAAILIAIYGNEKIKISNIESQKWIDNLVNKLLFNADFERWFSVSTMLPQLAEASPEAFLNSIEKSLESDNPVIVDLFKEGKDPMFSRCNHSGLLWGLEALAWKPNYLKRVTLILGKLSRLDPGGRWANRPIASLRATFLAWLPYTMANVKERLEALDRLIEKEPQIAFELLIDLLPKFHDIGHPTYKPRWRWFSELNEVSVTYDEMYETYSQVLDRLLKIASNSGLLLARIFPSYDNFDVNEDREKFYNHINLSIEKLTDGKKELWSALRVMISRHRTHPGTQRVLPDSEIVKLQTLYNNINLDDTEDQYKWLFDEHYPNLLEGERKDYKDFEKKIEDERIKAINVLIKKNGVEGIIAFAEKVNLPFFLGETLAKTMKDFGKDEMTIIGLFDKNNLLNFARGYTYHKMRTEGEPWIEKIVNLLKTENYNIDQIVNFLVALDEGKNTWSLLKNFDKDVNVKYWEKCNGFFRGLTPDEYNFGYKNLLEQKRYLTAMDSASMNHEDVSSEIILDILEKTITSESNEPYKDRIDPHNVADLFKILDKRNFGDHDKMLQLEWYYISILSEEIWGRPPKLLHKDMADNPSSFMQVIKMIYKPKDDEEMEKSETERKSKEQIELSSMSAYKLLKSFDIIPGTDEACNIDFDKLLSWIKEVKRLSIENKREYIGAYLVGELLARANKRIAKLPPEAVCKAIEELKDEVIEEGYYIQERNNRGGSTRGRFEGGRQEREIAKKYSELAISIESKYSQMSKILKKLADSYEWDADREDQRAKEEEMDY